MKTSFSLCCALLLGLLCATQTNSSAAVTSAGSSLTALSASGKISVTTVGTGKSIGHVADLRIHNLTGRSLRVEVPPLLLESRTGKFQHYACFRPQVLVIEPHGHATVRLDGVCLVHDKPPVGKGVEGELLVCDGNPATPRPEGSHFTAKDAGKLVRVAKSYDDAARILDRQGAFENMPYHNPKERQEIATQWGVWSDRTVSHLAGGKRAARKDLRETLTHQAEKKQPLTPEAKRKLDQGVDEIFKDVELTSKKAKAIEEPDPFAGVELTGQKAKSNT